MFQGKLLRRAGIFTLVLFCWFYLAPNFSYAQEEDDLLRARKLYQEGYYDDAITLLNQCINKLKSIVEQKRNVAEAFYLLAKVYYTVGEDAKVIDNLNKLFKTYPTFEKDETDLEFKDQVDKARKNIMAGAEEPPVPEAKEQGKIPETVVQTEKQPEEKIDQQVIEKPVKKKKKRFPILLVIGGLVIAGALVYFLVIKKDSKTEEPDFDIRGNWRLDWTDTFGSSGYYNITFTGSLTSGTFIDSFGDAGNYTVSVNNTLVFRYNTKSLVYTGNLYSNNSMGGTWVYGTNSGSWNGIKIGTSKSGLAGNETGLSLPRDW